MRRWPGSQPLAIHSSSKRIPILLVFRNHNPGYSSIYGTKGRTFNHEPNCCRRTRTKTNCLEIDRSPWRGASSGIPSPQRSGPFESDAYRLAVAKLPSRRWRLTLSLSLSLYPDHGRRYRSAGQQVFFSQLRNRPIGFSSARWISFSSKTREPSRTGAGP